MKKKLFKQYKLNQFKRIQQKYKYIYIFRYSDFNISDIIKLKKKLQQLNCNFLFFKKKLIQNKILNLKGQGSILILYSNQYNNLLLTQILNTKKLNFLFLIYKNIYYSNLKIQKITFLPFFLNYSLLKPFSFLLYFLKKAYIT